MEVDSAVLKGALAIAKRSPFRGDADPSELEEARTDGVMRLFVKNATHLLEPLQKIISRSRQPVHSKITPISLEHPFLHLTGSELRE